jgi:hypothetical protein
LNPKSEVMVETLTIFAKLKYSLVSIPYRT